MSGQLEKHVKNIARFSTILAVTVCLALLSVIQAQEKKDQPKPSPGLVMLTAKTTPLPQAAKTLTIKGTCLFGGRTGTWSGVLTPTGTAGVYDVKYVADWGSNKGMTYSGQVKTDLKTEISGNGKATGGGGNGTFEFSGKFGDNGVAKCTYTEVGGSRRRSGTLTVDSIK